MTEYPGYLPWYVAGDEWFTYDELNSLIDAAEARYEARKKANDAAPAPEANKKAAARRPARPRRR